MKYIEVKNGAQNNLKNVSVKIPLGKMTVICGLSGSGKSSLAFETLFAEGQRRYLESLSNYVKQYVSRQKKPLADSIKNLPPALALEQKNNIRSRRSLTATASGLADHLRPLFAHAGVPVCEKHKTPLKSFSPVQAADFLIENFPGEKILIAVPIEAKSRRGEDGADDNPENERDRSQGAGGKKSLKNFPIPGIGPGGGGFGGGGLSGELPAKDLSAEPNLGGPHRGGPNLGGPPRKSAPRGKAHRKESAPGGGSASGSASESGAGNFLKLLRRKGFSRLLVPLPFLTENSPKMQIQRIEELQALPDWDFFVLIDRLVIDKKERSRLIDSLEQAFSFDDRTGNGFSSSANEAAKAADFKGAAVVFASVLSPGGSAACKTGGEKKRTLKKAAVSRTGRKGAAAASGRAAKSVQMGAVTTGENPADMIWLSPQKSRPCCPYCRFHLSVPLTPSLFSFNSPLGACPSCKGAGEKPQADKNKILKPHRSLRDGALVIFESMQALFLHQDLMKFCEEEGVPLDKPWRELDEKHKRRLWNGRGKWTGVELYLEYLEAGAEKRASFRNHLARFQSLAPCPDCRGTRLRKEAALILLKGESYNNVMEMSLEKAEVFFSSFSKKEANACGELLARLQQKIRSLNELGLSYLSLNRPVSTLSGGEFQRMNLAGRIGTGFSQMLYVLDEPTVGLHPQDTERMLQALKRLKNLGNTLVVVEHDQDVIEQGDFIIEMGPGAGSRGGEVVWSGSALDFRKAGENGKGGGGPHRGKPGAQTSGGVPAAVPFSNTANRLFGEKRGRGAAGSKNLKSSRKSRKQNRAAGKRPVDLKSYKYLLSLKGCSGRNLKNIDLHLPLNRFVAVTGVSGSGKSSLMTDTLYPALLRELKNAGEGKRSDGKLKKPLPFRSLEGGRFLQDVFLLSQSDLKSSQRSSVASYLDIYPLIRGLFAMTPDSLKQELTPSHFSFNADRGRCPECKGLGFQEIDMVFMDPISVVCGECQGRKFKENVLSVSYRGKNIYEVLNLSVEEARSFFRGEAAVLKGLSALSETGLSYLSLGRSFTGLSGGEKQRLKLARELLQTDRSQTLYILDEPTKGLHLQEVWDLADILHNLVESGGTVAVIEHNLEIIRAADCLIDIGPEGGAAGGRIVAAGPPETVAAKSASGTAKALSRLLKKDRRS